MVDSHPGPASSVEPLTPQDEASRHAESRERHLRQAIASAPIVVFITDSSGDLTLVEGEGLGALGVDTSSQRVNLVEAVSDLPEFAASLQEALSGEAQKSLITSPAGSVFEMTLTPVFSAAGEVSGVVGIGIDITLHRRIEEALLSALKRADELYRVSRTVALARTPDEVLRALMAGESLADASRAAIAVFDKPWDDEPPESVTVLAEWNRDPAPASQVGRRMGFLEYNLGALYSRQGPTIVHADDERLTAPGREVLAGIGSRTLMSFPLVASGIWYGMLVLHSPQRNIRPEALTHLQSLVDTLAAAIYTVNLLKTEALARKEAERANYMKMRLLGTISHELRTPLTSIKGFAATLLASDVRWDAESQVDFIETIAEEADKMTDLVGHLLDLTRLESGTLRISPEPTTVQSIMDVAHSQLITVTRHHRLTLDLDGALPTVWADTHRVAQVIVNLVNNAVKYSPQGSSITVSARPEDVAVRFDVRDQGAGIPEHERERVFEAFHQVSGAPGDHKPGVGLGLAISRGIVDAHGGTIWVAESGPQGTVFAFTLRQFSEEHAASPPPDAHPAEEALKGNGHDTHDPNDVTDHYSGASYPG